MFFIQLTDIPGATSYEARRRRRRRGDPGPIQRLLDPEREHPILKNLIQTFGPLIQQLITTQLIPLFIDPDVDEPEP